MDKDSGVLYEDLTHAQNLPLCYKARSCSLMLPCMVISHCANAEWLYLPAGLEGVDSTTVLGKVD